MGQPQRIALADPDCEVKLTTSEVAHLIGMVQECIDQAEDGDEIEQEELPDLKVLRHKLERAMERG